MSHCPLAAVALLALVGCQGLLGPQKMPADPLFELRKPVEARIEKAAPPAIAFVEPAVPSDPMLARKERAVPGTLTGRTPGAQPEEKKGRD